MMAKPTAEEINTWISDTIVLLQEGYKVEPLMIDTLIEAGRRGTMEAWLRSMMEDPDFPTESRIAILSSFLTFASLVAKAGANGKTIVLMVK